jgi:2,3-dihydroxybiphenyl 1,2-dioxygenase
MQLGYFGIGTRNLEAWEEFGTQVLGLESAGLDGDGALVFRLDSHHRRIGVYPDAEEDLLYAGWEVRNGEELAAITTRLEAAGVDVQRGSSALAGTRGVKELICFTDPDGLRSEIYCGPRMSYDRPLRSPRGVSGFITGTLGLGHLVVRSVDVAATQRFYCETLGFRLTDVIHMQVTPDLTVDVPFLHCNPRHHSLALLGLPLPKRMQHFMIEVRSLDDVGFAWDLAQRRNIEITLDLGRHSNDHMVSFYMRTPSGFEVEYGYGARTVDSDWTVEQHTVISAWGHRVPASVQEAQQK